MVKRPQRASFQPAESGVCAPEHMGLSRREVLVGLAGVTGTQLLGSCILNESKRSSETMGWLKQLPPDRRRALSAAVERILPGSVAAGALAFIDYWLRRPPMNTFQHQFNIGGVLLNRTARQYCRTPFAGCSAEQQDAVLAQFQRGTVSPRFNSKSFFERLATLTLESYLGDPKYGGNKERAGWKSIDWDPCWWSPKKVGQLVVGSAKLPY